MKIVAFVISMVLFLGGFLLLGYAFVPDSGWMFFAGILAFALAIFVPVHILKRLDR